MSFKNDFELLNDFATTRNLKDITKTTYFYSVQLYTQFHNLSFVSLLNEAETEENKGIRWKYRRIKRKLLSFRNFLAKNYMKNYVKSTFTRIITIYRHYEIEIHEFPPLNSRNYNETAPITYTDLPDREIIRRAIRKSDSQMKAIILFMVSSGCARRETLNLTVNDIILATKDYHDAGNIYEVIDLLKSRNDIVPTFKLKRQKTNRYYFTFCSPEAIKQILRYLSSIDNLTGDDRVFDMHSETFSKKFAKINEKLDLGKAGSYNRFRSHMLRKYHASSLKNDGMSISNINSMQGKSKNIVDESYFFENPEKLKETYVRHLAAITILSKRSRQKIKPVEVVKLEIENRKLRKEVELLRNHIAENVSVQK